MIGSHGWGEGPALEAEVTSSSRQILGRVYSPVHGSQVQRVRLSSTTVDSGNTPTSELRAGLPLAYVSSLGEYAHWDPDAAGTGQEFISGLLLHDMSIQNYLGTAGDKPEVLMLTHGVVLADMVDPGGLGDIIQIKQMLGGRITFDDDIANQEAAPNLLQMKAWVEAATFTVPDTANNRVYHMQSVTTAVVTLPAILDGGGQYFKFFNLANQTLTIASAETGNIVAFNDLAADSVSYGTTGEKIGAVCEFQSINIAGTPKWVYTGLSTGGATSFTVTIA